MAEDPTTVPAEADVTRALYMADEVVSNAFRNALENDLREWKLQWVRFDQERRAKQRIVHSASVQGRRLRAGLMDAKNQNGVKIDFHNAGLNELRTSLGQLEYQMEVLEAAIDEGTERLAALPPPALPEGIGSPEPDDQISARTKGLHAVGA